MMKKIFPLVLLAILSFINPAFSGDKDKDGIPNKYDECPNEAEDMDNFEDTDGCPDLDNDKDGVPDTKDKCPRIPEDKDGFQDNDGCPDKDNDKDGILDKKDKCPDEPEDFDAFEDTDGCPEKDNDKDGIPDTKDKCPKTKEDLDKFEDDDGCPEYDNDKDGLKDEVDKCPNEPESLNGVDDEDGCPDTGILPLQKLKILNDVKFRTGTDEFTFESFRSLDSLAKQLETYPDKQVKILHYAKFPVKVEKSIELLAKQHEALQNYLISKGAKPEQFVPVEYSLEKYEEVKDTPDSFNQDQPIEVHLVD